jgi:Tfp pilus assembly protein PilN
MIKINLLPQRRVKRTSAPDESARPMVIGVAALVVAGVAVALVVDRPKRARLTELRDANAQLQADIAAKNRQLVGYTELKKSAEEAEQRFKAIQRLVGAKVVPANLLHELGEILTTGKYPTMTEDMVKRTGNGPEADPNKRFQPDWDPSNVWMSGFTDTAGDFKLEGLALTDSDITQLSKRLAASVYFDGVTIAQGGERVADPATGNSFIRFTITGKVAY